MNWHHIFAHTVNILVYEICGCQGVIPVFFHLLYLLLLFTPYPVTRFAISRHRSLTVEYKKNARRPYGTCFFSSNYLFYFIIKKIANPSKIKGVQRFFLFCNCQRWDYISFYYFQSTGHAYFYRYFCPGQKKAKEKWRYCTVCFLCTVSSFSRLR